MDKKITDRGGQAGSNAAALPAECRSFLGGYSEFRDGRLGPEQRAFFLGHMSRCSACRRYDRVIRKGTEVLRQPDGVRAITVLSLAEVRRRARAFEQRSLALGTAGSGVTMSAAVLVALLLAAVAWSPFFSGTTPEVEMPPVVAGAPPPTTAPAFVPLVKLLPSEPKEPSLWSRVRSLFADDGPGGVVHTEPDPDPD